MIEAKSKGPYPTSNDDSSDNRNKSEISKPSLPLKRHSISKHRREKRRGSPQSPD